MGSMMMATRERRKFMPIMNTSASTIITTSRNTMTNCSWKKLLMRSTSEVQRWITSPVGFSACHLQGSCWMRW